MIVAKLADFIDQDKSHETNQIQQLVPNYSAI